MITYQNIGYNGRFGNQIFQFAGTIGIGEKLGYDVLFPNFNIINSIVQINANGVAFNARFDLLDCFDIDKKYFSNNILINKTKRERFFHFDKELFEITDMTNIDGYLQSEKYFEHCKEKIINTLKIKQELIDKANNLLPKTDKELVSIHIRRGDYLYLEGFHSLNGIDYVEKAIEELNGNFHYIISSDDIEWCKGIWNDKNNFTVIDSKSPYIDFVTLSLCQHHIISNSSFSWWSSYLSKNKTKKIIAPKNWFGEKMQHDLTDLYTKEMIII